MGRRCGGAHGSRRRRHANPEQLSRGQRAAALVLAAGGDARGSDQRDPAPAGDVVPPDQRVAARLEDKRLCSALSPRSTSDLFERGMCNLEAVQHQLLVNGTENCAEQQLAQRSNFECSVLGFIRDKFSGNRLYRSQVN